MRVRKLTSDGDMTIGHGIEDFHVDSPDGVAQNVMTRLQLWKGSWFIDTEEGTPWMQEILGKHDAIDAVVKSRILDTPGVKEITSSESILNPDDRKLTITATISTSYGEATIGGTL